MNLVDWLRHWRKQIRKHETGRIRLPNGTTFSGTVGFRRRFYDWSLNAENRFNRQRYVVAQINGNQVYPGAPINAFTNLVFRFRYCREPAPSCASTRSSSIAGW